MHDTLQCKTDFTIHHIRHDSTVLVKQTRTHPKFVSPLLYYRLSPLDELIILKQIVNTKLSFYFI